MKIFLVIVMGLILITGCSRPETKESVSGKYLAAHDGIYLSLEFSEKTITLNTVLGPVSFPYSIKDKKVIVKCDGAPLVFDIDGNTLTGLGVATNEYKK